MQQLEGPLMLQQWTQIVDTLARTYLPAGLFVQVDTN